MSKRILITGGAGYLGSVLCKNLLEKGYSVTVYDKLLFGRRPIDAFIKNKNFRLIEADILEFEQHKDLLEEVDCVIHLASLANDPSCEIDPEYTEKVNYGATVALAKMCKNEGVDKFIFASSCSVYGTGCEEALDENSSVNPVSLYAKTKAKSEEALLRIADEYFKPVCLRQATLFGYSPRMRFDLAINLMVMHALVNGKIIVMGKGSQWRPFLHVEDSAGAFIKVIESPLGKAGGEIFNVGATNLQIYNLALKVKDYLNQDIQIEIAPDDEDRRNYHVNFSKFDNWMAFRPKYSIEEGILEIANVLRNNTITDPMNNVYYNIRVLKEFIDKPAVVGGKPASDHYIHFSIPSLGKEEEDEVIDTLRSGWITMGPKVVKFENMLSEYLGVKHAVAVDSCTSALHLSLVALGIGEGDEIITTPMTWPATANVIIHQRAKPVFVDIDIKTLNIDIDKIEGKITSRTKVIIPVHMAGFPCNMEYILTIAKKYNLAVVEDAAHALGAVYFGEKVGTIGDITCFSFYPIKNITTIEGGILATNIDTIAEKARILRLHGVVKDAWKRYGDTDYVEIDTIYPGYKCNMTDVEASLGIWQLKKLESFIEIREKYAKLYDASFSQIPEISIIGNSNPMVRHARHLYIIMLNLEKLKINRNEFIDILRKENIGAGVHFRSLHLQTYYKNTFVFKEESFPNAKYASERIVSLPLYPKMTYKDVHNVINAVRKIINFYRR